jgi:hypothetical protein
MKRKKRAEKKRRRVGMCMRAGEEGEDTRGPDRHHSGDLCAN